MRRAGALVRASRPVPIRAPAWPRPGVSRHARALAAGLAICALVALGLSLRLWSIDALPFGFHTDEGHNALDAWRIASEGWRPWFLEGNNGREPLFMYLMALSMALLGPSIASARLAGALCGGIAILAQLLLVASLPFARARRVAYLSAGFLALSFWPLAQARYALRANLLPVWTALALWAWWLAVDRPERWRAPGAAVDRDHATTAPGAPVLGAGTSGASSARAACLLWAALAGAFVALAAHTHLTGRVLILVFVASAAWRAVRDRRADLFLPLGVACATALVVAWPQIRYFQERPEMLSYRAAQVSLANPEVNEGDLAGALAENATRLLRAPVIEGDRSWYHNLKGRPVWPEPPAILAFLVGLGVALRLLFLDRDRRRQHAVVFLAAALGLAVSPSLLSVGAPNYVRLTAAWPVLFLLPALGLDALMAPFDGRSRGARGLGLALALLTLGWVGLQSARDYFGTYAAEPAVRLAFNAAAVERGQRVASLSARGPAYVSPALWRQSVIRFVTLPSPPIGEMALGAGLRLPPPREDAGAARGGAGAEAAALPEDELVARYLFDPAEAVDAASFGARWPGMLRSDLLDSAGALSLVAFELSGTEASRIESAIPRRARPEVFGSSIRLARSDAVVTLLPEESGTGDGDGAAAAGPEAAAREQRLGGPDRAKRVGRPSELELRLVWEALAPTPTDHNLFVHVLRASDGQSLAQYDGPPLGGGHPTDRWQTGERVLETLVLPLAEGVPQDGLRVLLGWYDWRDGARLPVEGGVDGAIELLRIDVPESRR